MSKRKKSKFLNEEVKKLIVNILAVLFIYAILYKFNLAKHISFNFIEDTFIRDKIKDNILLLACSLMYYFIVRIFLNILKIITKPVQFNVNIVNALDGGNYTQIYHFQDSEIPFEAKVVLEIEKTNSFWNRLALKVLKNKVIQILICVEPRNGNIYCQPSLPTVEYVEYKCDFGILVSEFVTSNLSAKVPFKREHFFLLAENRDKPMSGNGEFPLKPILLIDGKAPSLWQKLFIKYNLLLEEGHYLVKYTIYGVRR